MELRHVFDPDPDGVIAGKVLTAFSEQPAFPLQKVKRRSFGVGGVYALFYDGPHPLYRKISSPRASTPIYVGKSDENVDSRLRSHLKSIKAAYNLEVSHFQYRVIPLAAEWSVLIEAIFHRHFNPVWNQRAFSGFGNNNPGSKRMGGRASNWDILHPGRAWALSMDRSDEGWVRLRAEQERWERENPNIVMEMFGTSDDELGVEVDVFYMFGDGRRAQVSPGLPSLGVS